MDFAQGWFELDERLLSSIREYVKQIPDAWRQNLEYIRILGAFYSVQARDWLDQHVGQPIDDFIAKLPALQEPGLPPDGPITEAMLALSTLDSNGDPISIVGRELVQLIDARGGVTVVFSDVLTGGGDYGVAPMKGMIWLPERYAQHGTQSVQANAALIGHELAHALQRDLPEFPDGWGPAGSWIFGPDGLDPLGFEYGSPMVGELVREVIIGPRMPAYSWQELFAQQGFSPEAIEHIENIASTGVPNDVHIAKLLRDTHQGNPPPAGGTPPAPAPGPPNIPGGVKPN